MGYLDNSGDIILDAVLTDTGRKRMARGDGSFKIVKFALGDDEIDYSLYRNSNNLEGRDSRGSAYYDLNILQLPVLEAFTNNASVLKSKLITYVQNDLLYLPVVMLNTILHETIDEQDTLTPTDLPYGGYFMTADVNTTREFRTAPAVGEANWTTGDVGIIFGDSLDGTGAAYTSNPIITDQGLNTNDLSVGFLVDGDARKETAYIIELDNRLFNVFPPRNPQDGSIPPKAQPTYIDDDNVASYFFAHNITGPNVDYFAAPNTNVQPMPGFNLGGNDLRGDTNSVIGTSGRNATGRYGSRFGFRLGASLNIQTSTNLFTTLGDYAASTDYSDRGAVTNYYFIDTVVRVTGYTTGYRMDIPIKILKLTT